MKVELTIRPNWETLKEGMEHVGLRDILARMSGVEVPADARIDHKLDSDERSGGSHLTARWEVDEIDPNRADLRDR